MIKFLIIDDDESIRKYLKFTLKKLYLCSINEADNGQNGFNLVNEILPDLVFLDISMPVMNGIQTLEKIRKESKLPNVPVIVLTSNSQKEIVSELFTLGIANYLLKPSSIKEIKERVDKVIPIIELVKENMNLKNELGHLKEYKENFLKIQSEFNLQKEAFNLIFNNSLDVIFIVDGLTKIIIDVNNSVGLILGFERRELIGKPFSVLFPSIKNDRVQLAINKLDVFDSVIGNQEFNLANGSTCFMDLTATIEVLTSRKVFLITLRKSDERKFNYDLLKEKELLLQEIHHRVKNNLQIIYSLLFLQSEYFSQSNGSPEDNQALNAFKESQSRVFSLSLVHEKIYDSPNLNSVNLKEYILSLTKSLFQTFGPSDKKIKLNLTADEIFLDIDSAFPCGLIINELVTNSLKHAFNNKQSGKIEIIIKWKSIPVGKDINEEVKITVNDDGDGLDNDFSIMNCKTLGLKLVLMLTKQIKGQLTFNKNNGQEFILTFIKRNV